MAKYLSLREMLELQCYYSGRPLPESLEFVFDTNAFRYFYEKSGRRVVATLGVLNQLSKNVGIFSEEVIKNLAVSLDLDVVRPIVTNEDKKIILEAAMQEPKDGKRGRGQIGMVDIEQIVYAKNLATGGEYVALVSNDKDIHNTVKGLAEFIPEVRRRVIGLSVWDYLHRKNSDLLNGLNRRFRNFLIHEIEKEYRAV